MVGPNYQAWILQPHFYCARWVGRLYKVIDWGFDGEPKMQWLQGNKTTIYVTDRNGRPIADLTTPTTPSYKSSSTLVSSHRTVMSVLTKAIA